MNTYADMVTLLMCFFVLLYAMSSIDSVKWGLLVKSFNPDAFKFEETRSEGDKPVLPEIDADDNPSPVPTATEEFESIYETINEYVQDNQLESSVEINRGEGFVFIVFRNNIFFDGNSYVLRAEGQRVLDVLCGSLNGLDDQVGEIRILGHTTQADPNRPNNIDGDRFLSSNRAVQVLVYMQKKEVISPQKLVSLGYGQYYPIAPFDTEANRSKNRRIEILITQNDNVNLALERIYNDLNIKITK